MGDISTYLLYVSCSFFTEIAIFIMVFAFLNIKIPWKRMLAPVLVIDLVVGSFVLFATLRSGGRLWIMLLLDFTIMASNLAAVLLMFEKDRVKGTVAVCLGYFCYYQIYTGTFITSFVVGSILSTVLCVILCYALGLVFRKLNVSECLNYILRDKRKRLIIVVFSLIFSQSWYGFLLLSGWVSDLMTALPYQTWLLSGLFLIFLLYVTLFARHRQKEEMQQTVLLQQQMYINNLEEMQKEVRMYRHDYKNMLSGLLLQAQEGNTSEVLEFIKRSAGNFDETIGRQIRETAQLSNLRQPELKSLILTKLAKMQEMGIVYSLEVINPVEQVNMNGTDLARVLGILLDNALEAAAEQEEGRIGLIFSSQKECVTIIVSNTVKEEPDLSRIFEEGYSTKGKNRGLGLASLNRILSNYQNAVIMTSMKENEFVQELKIS